ADGSSCGTFDCNGDGVVNVSDYAQDPRVSLSYAGRTGPTGLITGQDLIHAFGACQIESATHLISQCVTGQHFDNDHNGFANDIAGWNFFDNNNEPADLSSYFAAERHGTGRAGDVADKGNDGVGSIGVCPHCQVMPIRIWDTFVSDANTFALGITYGTDNGAKVIEGANGSLYHSAFAESASQYAYEHGVVQTFSGDDLNTGNHNYPANYAHAMLIQGTVPDTAGLGTGNKQWLEGEKLCGFTGQPACFGSNAAVGAVLSGDIPPEATIDSPDWYAPLTGSSVEITGLARARFASGGQFHWKLMWGPGETPTSWRTLSEGDSASTVSDFGSLDLEAVRRALATYVVPPDSGGPTFAPGKPNPYQKQFSVQLEVSGQGIPLTGIDRRVFETFTDPTLLPGYPKRLGSG